MVSVILWAAFVVLILSTIQSVVGLFRATNAVLGVTSVISFFVTGFAAYGLFVYFL